MYKAQMHRASAAKRHILPLILGLSVMPAVAYGQWDGRLVFTANGGSSEIWINPGDSFTLTVALESNQPVNGLQYRFSVNGDADNAAFTGSLPDDASAYGSLFSLDTPHDPNLFDPDEDLYSRMRPGPVSLQGLVPELIYNTEHGEIGGSDMSVFPGTLLHYTITHLGSEIRDYVFGADDVIFVNSQGALYPETMTVHIVPEPSALTLLAALGSWIMTRRKPVRVGQWNR